MELARNTCINGYIPIIISTGAISGIYSGYIQLQKRQNYSTNQIQLITQNKTKDILYEAFIGTLRGLFLGITFPVSFPLFGYYYTKL